MMPTKNAYYALNLKGNCLTTAPATSQVNLLYKYFLDDVKNKHENETRNSSSLMNEVKKHSLASIAQANLNNMNTPVKATEFCDTNKCVIKKEPIDVTAEYGHVNEYNVIANEENIGISTEGNLQLNTVEDIKPEDLYIPGSSTEYNHQLLTDENKIRKRSHKITEKQQTILVDFMTTHKKFALSQFDGPQEKYLWQRKWEELVLLLNEVGPPKGVAQWKTAWRDMRGRARSRRRNAELSGIKQNGNPQQSEELSVIDKKVLSIIDSEAIGLQGVEEAGFVSPAEESIDATSVPRGFKRFRSPSPSLSQGTPATPRTSPAPPQDTSLPPLDESLPTSPQSIPKGKKRRSRTDDSDEHFYGMGGNASAFNRIADALQSLAADVHTGVAAFVEMSGSVARGFDAIARHFGRDDPRPPSK